MDTNLYRGDNKDKNLQYIRIRFWFSVLTHQPLISELVFSVQ